MYVLVQYYIRSDDMIRTFHKLTITIPSTVPQIAFFFHFLFILSLDFCAPPPKFYTQFHAHNATAQKLPVLGISITLKALLIK